jgi:putative ABC transport system permease protein
LVSGRSFEQRDAAGTEPVIIVSQSFAEQEWPDQSPIGRRVRRGSWRGLQERDPWRRIVGVVSDVRGTLVREEFSETYVPLAQDPRSHMYLLTRTKDPDTVGKLLPGIVSGIDPTQPIAAVETLDDIVRAETSRPRFLTGLLSAFAIFAVLLAVTGTYTVVAYAAIQRQREIAIRIALGAQRLDVLKLFLANGIRTALLAVVVGTPGAVILSQVLSSQIQGVPPPHPFLYVVLAAIMILAVMAAVLLPAHRAYHAEAATVLREL